jgi:inosine-uridine nucleoside N-ribohydrolase
MEQPEVVQCTSSLEGSDSALLEISRLHPEAVLDVIFDMETGDPDDWITLCLLASHPGTNLRAVTVTPGTAEQVGLIRQTLAKFPKLSREAKIGVRSPGFNKRCVSIFHNKIPGLHFGPEEADGLGCDIIYETLKQWPYATIITGAPLGNLGALLKKYNDVVIHRWVAQGGFAGDNIVPADYRLKKFEGKLFCPTYNFGGDPASARALLDSPRIKQRILVSKNVCHDVLYNKQFHTLIAERKGSNIGLNLIYEAMTVYFEKKSHKALHDPLAACVCIDPTICLFAQVELRESKERGQRGWGSVPSNYSNTFISVVVDKERFAQVFSMTDTNSSFLRFTYQNSIHQIQESIKPTTRRFEVAREEEEEEEEEEKEEKEEKGKERMRGRHSQHPSGGKPKRERNKRVRPTSDNSK